MAAPTSKTRNQSICDKFSIPSLTDEQNAAINDIQGGKDVFLCTRTGGGKSLTYECYPLLNPTKCVIVIAPLITIMDEQCKKLTSLGFRATYIGFNHQEEDDIVAGMFDFVFGSPEQLLDGRFRDMLRSDTYQEKLGLLVVDEAHTVIHWDEGAREEVPLRESFSKIGELRSLCPQTQMVALTATAGPTQRRKILKSLCFKPNSTIIHDSADRQNIKISSKNIPNTEPVERTFKWLLNELYDHGAELPRHVIFCESISDVSKIYSSFINELSQDSSLEKHINMYHSKTNEKVKEKIRCDMAVNGNIRILICTNAAGMGVNLFGVYNVIHHGLPRLMDTFVQQMGRAGRDGNFSQELILFKSHKGHLSKVETDLVKLAKDTESCRHQLLCDTYLNERVPIIPLHNCCDFCEEKCECADTICPNKNKAFIMVPDTYDVEEQMERPVSELNRKRLKQKLISLKYALTDQAGSSYLEADIHGLTDSVIADTVEKCNLIFSVDDIMRMLPIWLYDIAQQLFCIISEVFGDTEMYDMSDIDSFESDS